MKHLLPLLVLAASTALAVDANRLTYLDDASPFWPTPQTPALTTPQWIGETGVEAAVILAIDDMRDPAKYEAFLRPILERLKKIDGRAPLSIMANTIPTNDPQLPVWLKEGVSLEVHTLTHPCPCLGKVSFAEAARTYHGGVDLLAAVPGSAPVAFRMPCCDSINSVSPRFFAEIFNRSSEQGRTLAIDSSVFTKPPGERFAKYFPTTLRPPMKLTFERYSGYIEDYPYPYVIGGRGWEFPCSVPSDWEAFNLLGPKSPTMLEDWKAALDYTVQKRGVFTAVFHPHGWSSPEQWVEFIDYAEKTYGKRVKFLNFPEALARLEKNALAGRTLRTPLGPDNGVRVVDVNADGFMDVVIGAANRPVTRVWEPKSGAWKETATPANFVRFGDDGGTPRLAALGVFRPSGAASLIAPEQGAGAWTYGQRGWEEDAALARELPKAEQFRFRDFDRDGVDEILTERGIFLWDAKAGRWQEADFALPEGIAAFDPQGQDNGLRFVDLNGDGYDDVFQANESGYAIYLWAGTVKANLGWKRGWPYLVKKGAVAKADDPANPLRETSQTVLPFVKNGENYGGWFHQGHVVWQNEDTFALEAHVLRRSFRDLIAFDVPAPLPPEDALKAMRPRPGFAVELVAAEPLVQSPVAFDWDADGHLWVVEMRDYPMGIDGQGKPGGVVKRLTDDDGDGRYDRADVFLEGLAYPTGIAAWRNGVLIAASKDILFAADRDGDGRAEQPRVLFTGFKEGNQQHRENGFEWGLDGWVYGANGDSGGEVGSPEQPGKTVSISGRDFRFRPDTGEFEAESGQTQFGRRRDDWGNWFGNNNSKWLWHYTIEDRYLRRNPKLAVKTTRQMLAEYPDSTRVFPQSALPIRFNQPQSLGHLTSGCSPSPYRDELFGEDYATSVFISEPVHNVVHREVLTPDGVSFTSKRAADEMEREFLASTDPWFRPTTLKTGPDGALYIADFYRFVLEHPEWIAPETQSRLDLRAGADKGRIYRVVPVGAKLRAMPKLGALDDDALAAAMKSPNGWQRDTVQRLLGERGARGTAPVLRRLAVGAENPKVRVQALATLAMLGELDGSTLGKALKDRDPRVRVQAVRSTEHSGVQERLQLLRPVVDDPELIVRRQLALSLGEFRGDVQVEFLLERLAKQDGDKPHFWPAVLSSLEPGGPIFAKLNEQWMKSSAPAAKAAQVVLPKPSTADRARVIESYAVVNRMKGNAVRGRELFQQQCSICHRLKGVGQEVGPDLAMVNDKPVDWLLTAIFDPSAAVEDRYRPQVLRLKSGVELIGLIAAETANNLVVKLPGGVEVPVLWSDLVEQRPAPKSLMPEGLETVLKPQDVADLVAALRER